MQPHHPLDHAPATRTSHRPGWAARDAKPRGGRLVRAAPWLLGALACGAGCEPELPGRTVFEASTGALSATLEPEAELGNAPPVFRVHLWPSAAGASSQPAPLAVESVVLVSGSVGKAQLRQLATGELSQALEERLIPAVRWQEPDGHYVLAPAIALQPGEDYAVASGLFGFSQSITVQSEPVAPVLARLWPPSDAEYSLGAALWCGAAPLPSFGLDGALAPGGPAGLFRSVSTSTGRWANGAEPGGCVWFEPYGSEAAPGPMAASGGQDGEPDSRGGASGWVPPPVVSSVGLPWAALLEPAPLQPGEPPGPAEPRACEDGERPFGPGCALVADDRMLVRAPAEPLLWEVSLPGRRWTVATGPSETFLVHPLPVAARLALELQVVDLRGAAERSSFDIQTAPPMAHVVLNEVLANPVGPEPAQEWVELYNDGLAPALLLGAELVDAGGVTVLPDEVLLPGAFALLVPEEFDERSEFDQPPAAGTLLVRVPALGKNGLSNDGEPLLLRGADGRPWSRFPAEPVPKSGQSVQRVVPRALDDASEAFARSEPAPSPGRPNEHER